MRINKINESHTAVREREREREKSFCQNGIYLIGYTNKGVTLVALIITIIVLLILAGIVFGTLMGNEGLLKRVSDARKCVERCRRK